MKNAAASIERVWFAQTHLMETNWPFFYLVENRPTLVKLDVSAPPGTPVPTISVTATFADGRSELRWMRAPASLPADVDLRPQPLSQDLSTSYAATLPASWLQKGVSLRFGDAGGPSVTKSASQLKIASRPELNLVVADVLLFTDTTPVSRSAAFGPELASKLPVSRLTIQPLPYPLRLPRLVVAPRTDSVSPFGDPVETSAMWVDKKAACTASMKTAGTCTPHSRWAVWEAVLDLTRALQAANGMSETSFWYGVMPDASNVTAWWSGGTASLANDFGKNFMHENGHSMSLPHLGGVTGTRQSSSTGLRHPYVGENIRTDGQFLGGALGRTFAWDPLDNAMVPPTCTDTGVEKQDPMQRAGCETVRPNRRLDHFSDISTYKLLRYLNGAPQVESGTVPYYSALLAGTSADAFAQMSYRLPVESGRLQGGTATAI